MPRKLLLALSFDVESGAILRVIKRLVFAALAVCCFFLGAELLFHGIGDPPQVSRDVKGQGALPDHYLSDDEIGWRHRPGAQLFDPTYEEWAQRFGLEITPPSAMPINALGFRDSELAEPRVSNQRRIFAAGDSSVLGVGCDPHLTYAQRLERQLNGRDLPPEKRQVEVINGGVSGYSSFQSLIQIKDAVPLGLDTVIFYNMNSDLMTANGSPDVVFFRSWSREIEGHYFAFSSLYRWLRYGIGRMRHQGRKVGEHALRVQVQDYRKNLNALADLSEKEGFSLVFILAPAVTDLLGEDDLSAYRVENEEMAKGIRSQLAAVESAEEWWAQERQHFRMAMALVAFERNIPLVDAPSHFYTRYTQAPEDFEGVNYPFADEIHPSAAGHRMLSALLLPLF